MYSHNLFQARDLKMLIRTYKEWSFQLFPTFAFEDVVSKTNKFGGRSGVRMKLDELRLNECQRYMKDVLGVSYQPSGFQNDPDDDDDDRDDIDDGASPHNTTAEDMSPFHSAAYSQQSKSNPSRQMKGNEVRRTWHVSNSLCVGSILPFLPLGHRVTHTWCLFVCVIVCVLSV